MEEKKSEVQMDKKPETKPETNTKRLCGRFTQRQADIIKLAPALAGTLIEDFITDCVIQSDAYKELESVYNQYRKVKK